MKKCSRCKEVKEFTAFCKQSRSKDGYQPACKVCMNISWNASRNKKKEHYSLVQQKRQQKVVEQYKIWKKQQKCVVCHESDESCLDLHHVVSHTKEVDVSDAVYKWSWKRVLTEIEKCVIVCSNCHRKIHAGKIKLRIS